MIIYEMNEGQKIDYDLSGSRLTFDDDLSINLAKREEDWPVHIDVCKDIDRNLVIGASAGNAYVAQIDIPARQYTESEEEDGEETVTVKIPVPFMADTITLSLWAVMQGDVNKNG